MEQLIKQFGFLAILAPILLFWQQSKGVISKIFQIFIKEREVNNDLWLDFYEEMYSRSWVYGFDDYQIMTNSIYHIPRKLRTNELFKVYKTELFLYKYLIPVLISGYNENSLKIRYLKYTFPFETIIKKIAKNLYEEISKREQDRFYIEEIRGFGLDKNSSIVSATAANPTIQTNSNVNKTSYTLYPFGIVRAKINRSILYDCSSISYWSPTDEEKPKYQFTQKGTYILDQVDKWLKAERWYTEKGMAWRRGVLLNGKPGSGKSSLIFEIAKKLKIPIYIFDLSTFTNQEFSTRINDLNVSSGIIVFEDIDNVFDGRNNITKTEQWGGLTFDCFINKLSGLKSITNKFVFITTNHLDKVDPALMRAGRIDEIIDLPMLNNGEKRKLASVILEDNNNLIELAINEGANDSTAEFENRCVQLALKEFWK